MIRRTEKQGGKGQEIPGIKGQHSFPEKGKSFEAFQI